MVTGTLRTVLWILGGLAVVRLLASLAMLPAMSRMMSGGMMQDGSMHGGMMDGGIMGRMGMGGMMGMMAAQWIAMLGLAGVFVYLIVDSARRRRAPRRF